MEGSQKLFFYFGKKEAVEYLILLCIVVLGREKPQTKNKTASAFLSEGFFDLILTRFKCIGFFVGKHHV